MGGSFTRLRNLVPYVVSLAGVALALLAVALLQGLTGTPGLAPLLYLVPVTQAAARWGRKPAFAAVFAAVIGHDALFVDPVGTLTITRPDEAVGLLLLLLTATAIAQLADDARASQSRAREAEVMRRSDALKTALLRAVSHDLRTPLASIKASISTLRQPDANLTDADRVELLAEVEEETDRLDRLVGKLLHASRLESGNLVPSRRPEDLGDLVRDTARRLRVMLAGHPLTLAIPDNLPAAACDYTLVGQTLTNLLENAARHTPPGTPITVTLSLGPDEVACTVADRGPGIAQAERERLLQPFERGRGAGPGWGLGLTIARGLTEAQGGRLWCTETANGGASFHFSLPKVAPR